MPGIPDLCPHPQNLPVFQTGFHIPDIHTRKLA